ncbi:MAG TPA: hypothetical protein VJP79_06470 [Nitrososphaera sp.]|nr:hypothetical protein [Nitrososphaera sp.]
MAVLFFGAAFISIALGISTSDIAQTSFFLLGSTDRIEGSIANLQDVAGYSESANEKSETLPHAAYVATQFPLRLAYGLYWMAVVMLLRRYSEKIGRLKFWVLITLPLVTFIVGSIFTYGDLVPQLYQGIILVTATLFGGILFGLIFLTIARALRGNSTDKNVGQPNTTTSFSNNSESTIWRHLTMSAFGTILFLITNNPTNHIIDWTHIPYPPYADVVWSFIGFASYMYSFGLFFSTISISQNTKLRKSMHNLAMDEADMLRGLGKARMHEEIQKRVTKISKEQEELLKEQTGIEQKVTEDEMKQYADEVMKEIQKVSHKY